MEYLRAVVEEQQAPPHNPSWIHQNVVEPQLSCIPDDRRRSNSAIAKLPDGHNRTTPGKDGVQAFCAWRDRHISEDVDTHSDSAHIQQTGQRPDHGTVGHGPFAQRLDVLFRDLNQDDSRVGLPDLGLPTDEKIIGGQLRGLQPSLETRAHDRQKYEDCPDCRDQEGLCGGSLKGTNQIQSLRPVVNAKEGRPIASATDS